MSHITHVDHIAIAVFDLEQAKAFYEEVLGLKVSHIEEIPQRKIKTAFIKVGQTMLELIEPMAQDSEISSFLHKKGPGLHHIALYTNNIEKDEKSIANKAKMIYPCAKDGAHQSLVNFIHPKSTGGVLLELVQKKPG